MSCLHSKYILPSFAPARASPMAPPSLADRIVRYRELRPCTTAFIDTRTPGSDKKENFTIIGPGVSENPDQYVHIDTPHGFNLGGARQPPGCVNSQHSHETAEVFIVQCGTWAFFTGEAADEGNVTIGPGDTISIPTQVFRGFKNVGTDIGFMFAVLGEDDPGRVTWAPSVFAAAKDYGLVLLDNGQLVDQGKGEVMPPNAKPLPTTTREQAESMRRLDRESLQNCIVRYAEVTKLADGEVSEYPIIGDLGLGQAKLNWPHGFSLRYSRILPGASTRSVERKEEQVVLVHRGIVDVNVPDGEVRLGRGDLVTLPVGLPRKFSNTSAEPAEIFVVYRGNCVLPLESTAHA